MWATSVRKAFDEARETFTKYTATRASADANKHLTAEGKLAACREWVEGVLPDVTKRLEAVRKEQGELETRTVKSLADGVMKRPEDPADIAELQEIRTFLRSLPDGERMDKLDFLVRKGDTTALRAVLTAPAYLTGLDENVVALLRDDVARKANPERYAKVEKLRKGLKAAERALEGVQRFMVQDSGPNANLYLTYRRPPRPGLRRVG
jgi:hypothetical protein